MMLGLGEEISEVMDVLRDLRGVQCDILTLGQYLRPSKDHLEVVALRPARRVRRTTRPRNGAGLPPRRIRPPGPQLLPRLGTRELTP